ncbi:tRNA(Ile)-lysidine synthase [Tistlia consotensis]|uniref:tRNA(Ile)-lysidine synthase n=1 Tax=Tistlia consotensis USBA 355 TaxID=560819 RepID=A0A1Y6BWQ1_9PROT|nr:tRNA lysidine(34) synthetase TilS [Tistlia consotensis]SMF32640.1 tRNA(Ile)-lysidine synthase [Tistlia consotensis USBA 355]SNR68752.1 tRNA(Ile)-lysidine synthase [Tistlia consotensis]
MARFAPFEPRPRLAVAVSGGADSLALLLLTAHWARDAGAEILALTVDHGLRPEAAAEAAWVGRLCAGLGIAHRSLLWRRDAPQPAGGLQAAARAARYRLLAGACREAGILHLVLGHQREDQAETFLLRLAAGSGPAGLAAMPAVGFLDEVRLLRPLLDLPRAGLEAVLRAAGRDWLDDPSNADPAYARVRLRRGRQVLAEAGLSSAACAELAETYGRLRRWSEPAVARLLAGCCRLDPRGFAWLERRALLEAPPPLALAALGRVLRTVAGREHEPRGPKLARLLARLGDAGPRGATLAGCRILPGRGGRLLVVREAAAIGGTAGRGPAGAPWDGRFRLPATAAGAGAPDGPVTPLGSLPPAERRTLLAASRAAGSPLDCVPAAAQTGLPTLRDLDGRPRLPHFTARRRECAETGSAAEFLPRCPLSAGSFTVFR